MKSLVYIGLFFQNKYISFIWQVGYRNMNGRVINFQYFYFGVEYVNRDSKVIIILVSN